MTTALPLAQPPEAHNVSGRTTPARSVLSRARLPRVGDRFHKPAGRMRTRHGLRDTPPRTVIVESVLPAVVCFRSEDGIRCEVSLATWERMVGKSLRSGAEFFPA